MAARPILALVSGAQALAGWHPDKLCAALDGNDPATKTVDLTANRLGEAAFCNVARALAANKTCEILQMNSTGFGANDVFAAALAEALRTNTTLRVVSLSQTYIGDEGACHLAEALKVNTSVTFLSLSATYIGDKGAEALAEALKFNTVLEEFKLWGTPITDIGVAKLQRAVATSRTLKRLFLRHPRVGAVEQFVLFGQLPGASSSVAAEIKDDLCRLCARNFKQCYDNTAPFSSVDKLCEGIEYILKHVGTESDVSEAQQEYLVGQLRRTIVMKAKDRVPVGAGIGWSSAQSMESRHGRNLTLYGCVQHVVRKDKRGKVMSVTACFCRSLNQFVVARRGGEPQAGLASEAVWGWINDAGLLIGFNASDNQKLEDEHQRGTQVFETRDLSFNQGFHTLYKFDLNAMVQQNMDTNATRKLQRVDANMIHGGLPKQNKTGRGAWLPLIFVKWFVPGETYRYPGYLATSDDYDATPKRFLAMFRPNADPVDADDQWVPVHFLFHFDPVKGCRHINLLENISEVQGEQEWLLQNYSALTVRTAADFSKPYSNRTSSPIVPVVIELDVIPDNKDVPDDVPLAKWH